MAMLVQYFAKPTTMVAPKMEQVTPWFGRAMT